MSRSYYTRLLDDVFVEVQRIVAARKQSNLDLSWVVKGNSPYQPDYFLIKTFGRNKIESKLNLLLFSVFPSIWKRYIWKKICKKMCTHLRDEHAVHFDLPLHDRKLFINVCFQHLYKHHIYWGNTTFTDIFIFIALFLLKFSEEVLKTPDRFTSIKKDQNDKMLALVNEIKDDIQAHPQCTSILAYLAIKGNWMDVFENDPDAFFLAFGEEVNELMDSDEILNAHKTTNSFFHIDSFLSAVEGAPKSILYECDNSGEVVLDLLLIEHLIGKGHTVTITTKTRPFLNDVLAPEIKQLITDNFPVLLDALNTNTLRLIAHDLAFAGKVFTEVNQDYKEALKQADFMIAKGQGHFQTMPIVDTIQSQQVIPYTLPVFYLLGVRADIIYWCCHALFKTSRPEKGTVMLYAYNVANPVTHPN